MEQFILVLAVVLGIGFSIGLFFLLPMLLSEFALAWIGSDFVRNLIEGVVRVAIFLGYMIAVSRLKDMKRVFSYHGAEHKTIRCYEAKAPADGGKRPAHDAAAPALRDKLFVRRDDRVDPGVFRVFLDLPY